jgi:hypothetical protein
MKKKIFLRAAMLLICGLCYGFIKPGPNFYTDIFKFFGLAIAFIVVIVSCIKICKKLKLWKK